MIVRKVFVSYARANRPHVEQLVEHLGVLDCQTWFDSSLRGGQDWWEQILNRITDCDVFIAIISREALNSVACEREFDWAEALGKPVLPVALQPPSQALPQRFSRRQIVDYSNPANRDRAALILAGGLAALPAAPELPVPLPEPPSAPLSYLTELVDRVSTPGFLDHDQQRQILFQLEAAVRSVDPEERRGGRDILERFSSRDDLYADVDRMITLLKGSAAPETDAKTVVAQGAATTAAQTEPATETEPPPEASAPPVPPPQPAGVSFTSRMEDRFRQRPPPQTATPPPPSEKLPRRRLKWPLFPLGIILIVLGLVLRQVAHPGGKIFDLWDAYFLLVLGLIVLIIGLVLMAMGTRLKWPPIVVTVAVIAAAIVVTSQHREHSNGSQVAPGYGSQVTLPFTGLNNFSGLAVDTAGNVYVADSGNSRVLELAAGSAAQEVLPFTGLSNPQGVAVDRAHNIYVTDAWNNRVLEQAAGSSTQSALPFTGLTYPSGVAVDTAGNVYITDGGGRSLDRVLKLPAGSSTESRGAAHRPHLPLRRGGGCRRQPLCHRRGQQSGGETGGGLVLPDGAAVHRPQ